MLDEGRRSALKKAIPLVLFVLAVLIRLPGIGWGLKNELHNASYHPDEPVIFGFSRGVVPGQLKFTPGSYNYGTLYLTLLRVASDVTTTYTGAPKGQTANQVDWDWVSRCVMAGRIISLFAGAGTVLVVFYIGRRCFGNAAGGLAGLVIAIAPGFVMHSRFQTVDVTATLLLALSLLFAIKIAVPHPPSEDQKPKAGNPALQCAIWSGVFAGLSAGTKYSGILTLLALAAALWLARPKGAILALAAGCLAAAAAFVVATPGALLDTQAFIRDVTDEIHHVATGHGLVFEGTPNGFIYNLMNLAVGINGLLLVLGLAGLFYAAYRRHRWAIVMLAFWLPYYVLIGRAEVKFLRYTFPLYTGVALGVGYAMMVSHRRGGWARMGVGAGILGFGGFGSLLQLGFGGFGSLLQLGFGGGLASTAITTSNMMSQDPRDATAEFLRQRGTPVGFVNNPWFWSPPLYPDATASLLPPKYRLEQMKLQANPPVVHAAVGADGNIPPWDPKLITDLHPDRVVFSSFEYLPLARLRGTPAMPGYAAQFLDLLDQRYTREMTFGEDSHRGWGSKELIPEDMLYAEPTLWVWKRK